VWLVGALAHNSDPRIDVLLNEHDADLLQRHVATAAVTLPGGRIQTVTGRDIIPASQVRAVRAGIETHRLAVVTVVLGRPGDAHNLANVPVGSTATVRFTIDDTLWQRCLRRLGLRP
jgi:hypothetical protein